MSDWIIDAILEDIKQNEKEKKQPGYFPFEIISKIPYVEIPGLNNKECIRLQSEAKNVLKLARNVYNFAEVAIVYNIKDSKTPSIVQSGTNSKIDILKNEAINKVISENNRNNNVVVICLHNHPNDTLFSLNDLYLFTKHTSILLMEVINTKGEVAFIKKNSYINLDNFAYNHITAVANDFNERCTEFVNKNGKENFQLGKILKLDERKQIIKNIYDDFALLGISYSGYINQDWVNNDAIKKEKQKILSGEATDSLTNMGDLYEDNEEDGWDYERD